MMNTIELNNKLEKFVQKHNLVNDAYALKREYAIGTSSEWQKVLNDLLIEGRELRVGIIGRVKAGKSSMLNALLFDGQDILPKAATPMTAALTIMQYSEQIRAEVDFFTENDIAEIKKKHALYLEQFEQLKKAKFEEQKERKSKRAGKKSDSSLLQQASSTLSGMLHQLSHEELAECQEKAISQAEREMKNSPYFASYDQYERMKQSGKSLSELKQFATIQANSIDELMNGELNQFVGSSGAFMPFTKSVSLHIPHDGLKGLQIIDTPGINDPVTSRGERTEELLKHCDVVLVVSPSGQFLSAEDTELLQRVTAKEGTQQAYLIASQVDNQLFGSEKQGLDNSSDVLARIAERLTQHARNVLREEVRKEPAMAETAQKLSEHQVLCSSSVAHALLQRFDAQHTWDSNMQHVWGNLNRYYPSTFGLADTAKLALNQLANIDRLHNILNEVHAKKTEILAQKRQNFETSKRKALSDYMQAWQNRLDEQVNQIQTTDVGELREQEKQLQLKKVLIEQNVSGVYQDLVSDIKLELDSQLKDKLSNEIRQYERSAEEAEGTVQESREVYEGRGGFLWLKKKYRTEYYDVQTVKASNVRRAIEEVRANLEDGLQKISESYTKAWRKKIYNQVVASLREALGDDDLDIVLINRTVKSVLARIPEHEFNLSGDLPSELKKNGTLKGSEAETFINAASEYASNLRYSVRDEIKSYISLTVKNLQNIDLANQLMGNLEDNIGQLLHEIENKEASLYSYQKIQEELQKAVSL